MKEQCTGAVFPIIEQYYIVYLWTRLRELNNISAYSSVKKGNESDTVITISFCPFSKGIKRLNPYKNLKTELIVQLLMLKKRLKIPKG